MKEFMTSEVLINWLMYLAGMTIYLLTVKIPAFVERGTAKNQPFKFTAWLRADGTMMIVNVLLVFMLTLGYNQLEKFQPMFSNVNRLIFGLIGIGGNTIVFKYLSRYSKTELEVINAKSNTADIMTSNTSTDTAEIISKMSRVTNTDVRTADPLNLMSDAEKDRINKRNNDLIK